MWINIYRYFANGGDGAIWSGKLKRNLRTTKQGTKLRMLNFGDNIGICMQYQTAEEVAISLAE